MSFCTSNGAEIVLEYSGSNYDGVTELTWTDVSDAAGMLTVSGGDKQTASYTTFDGTVRVGLSKQGVQNIGLTVVFENDEASFLEFLTDTWDGTEDKCLALRWTYNDAAEGALRFVANVALLTNPFPGGDANSGAPITKSLTFAVNGSIFRETVPVTP